MVKRFVIFLLLIGSTLLLKGCSKKPQVPACSKIKVVSTTAMISEIVNQIGQDKIESVCLIQGDIDPHSYELVKGDQAKLSSASVIFYQGLGLEHGASLVSYLKSQNKAFAVGDVLQNNHADRLIYHDGYLDPHVWLDLDLWEKTVPFIKAKLTEIDPENKDFYEMNAQALSLKMQKLDVDIQTLLKEVPDNKRYLVTAHSAFSYFTKRYIHQHESWHERCMAPEGLAPEAQISLYDIEKVVAYISAHNIGIIFSESNVSKDAINKILDVCKKSGLKVKLADSPLFGDALFNEKGYLDMMWHNATLLHQAWHEQSLSSKD